MFINGSLFGDFPAGTGGVLDITVIPINYAVQIRQSKRKNCMRKTVKKKPTADEIAEMAMGGEDVSRFFTNKGEMRPPVKRINVDFTLDMIKELDAVARELNISRQAVIKAYLRQALDQHYLARQSPQ